MPGQGDESPGAHRRPDEQQDRLGTGVVAPDVVVEHGARRVQGVGLRLGHGCPLYRVLDLRSCGLTTPAKLIGPARQPCGPAAASVLCRGAVKSAAIRAGGPGGPSTGGYGSPGHASRWAGCLTDPWHEYASIRS